jgi:hydrogenase maturation protein HypF
MTTDPPAEATETVRKGLRVEGVVQAVGFRPFVHRTATDLGLTGWVRNAGDAGVRVVLEGRPVDVEAAVDRITGDPPPLAEVRRVETEELDPAGHDDFEVRPSTEAESGSATVPPDTGICRRCLADLRDPGSRFHEYWATSCVDCGPRFTVVDSLPFDRERTAMSEFPLCERCRDAYEDPSDRRYHAQAVACSECGPDLELLAPDGTTLATGNDAIDRTGAELRSGDTVAIKGAGGTHVACDATDAGAVRRLREGLDRPAKPFAVMVPSTAVVESFADLSSSERDALGNVRRPIVAVERSEPGHRAPDWLDAVAPGLHTVGVMLPYSGLHHLLFDRVDRPLVVTSGNRPGRPMRTTRESILDELGDTIGTALVHDRPIVNRCDDSVLRYVDGHRRFLRRSRGWVPESLPRGGEGPPVLAVGAEFDVTVALAAGNDVVLSQHVGDVDCPATAAFHREAIEGLLDIVGADPAVAACDAHPDYLTGDVASDRAGSPGVAGPVEVQHHHAHAAALLAERGRERAVVVTADGTGYGPDGSVWGGDVLTASRSDYQRVGGLGTFSLPGGSAAIENPGRIAAALLSDPRRIDDALRRADVGSGLTDRATVRRQADRGLNAPAATSAGRFLDAVSALLGVCTERSYQGEPAMRLEAAASRGSPLEISVPYDSRDGRRVVDVHSLFRTLDDLRKDHPVADVAATAQSTLADGLGDIAVSAARELNVDAVGFTGGVAYNDAISRRMAAHVRDADLEFLVPRTVPPGDGGIAYGQAVVATDRLEQ